MHGTHNSRYDRRWPLMVLPVLILASIACSFPAGGTPTATVAPPTISPGEPTTAPPTTAPPTAATPPTAQPPAVCTPNSLFVRDVTVPDGTPLEPGDTITKTWRMRNTGDCTWDSRFSFVQIRGTSLLANPSEIPLPQVAPGAEVDVSVQVSLSLETPLGSTQRATFQMRAPDGQFFGQTPFVEVLAQVEGVPVPTPIVGSATGAIGGTVWSDYCNGATGGPGCVAAPGGGYTGNGVFDGSEAGIAGVRVSMKSGTCPGSGTEGMVLANADGVYRFTGLAAGTYCVYVDPTSGPNASLLIPGGFTYPGIDAGSYTVTLAAGGVRENADFGWDFQFD